MNAVAECETCGKPLEYRGMGRPRKFCSEGCRTAARNRRRSVVPRYVFDAEAKRSVQNPSPRPKSKVR